MGGVHCKDGRAGGRTDGRGYRPARRQIFSLQLRDRLYASSAPLCIMSGRSGTAAHVSLEFLYRLANFIVATASLSVVTLIVVAIGRRDSRRPEPLGIVFCLVFAAV